MGKWVKMKKHSGPDIWQFENKTLGKYPAIAIVKKNNKVIAEFWGPKNCRTNEIIKHIRAEYKTKGKLTLYRIDRYKRAYTITI